MKENMSVVKINYIFYFSRSNQMPSTDQITNIASYCAPITEVPSNISTMDYLYNDF